MPGWPGAAGFERWAGKRTGNYGQFRGLRQPSGTAGSGAVNAPDPAVAAPRRTGLLRSTAVFSAMRSEEHTSELQSLMRISYAVFCLKKNTKISHLYLKQKRHTK